MSATNAAAADGLACRLCADRFVEPDHLGLHLGRTHASHLTTKEQVAFDEALTREEELLGRIRVHVKAGFAVVPIFLFFMFTIIGMIQLTGNIGFLIVLLPGFAGFGGLVYFMVISRAEYHRIEAEKAETAHAAAGEAASDETQHTH